MNRRFTTEQERLIAADYLAEMPRPELLAKWDCSDTSVYGALRRQGVPRRGRDHVSTHKRAKMRAMHRVFSDEQEQRIASDYANNPLLSARVLGERHGVCESTARNVIRRRGGVVRVKTRNYLVNEHVFERADQVPDVAYLVGFAMADGCVTSRNGGRVVILYQCNDDGAKHLEKLKQLMGSNHPIHTVRNTTGYSGRGFSISHKVEICSRTMAESLERWGVCERKSDGCKFLGGLEDSADAWRGAVDGDGWVSYRPADGVMRVQCGLCGAPDLIRQFMGFCRSVVATRKTHSVDDRIWRFNLVGWPAVQLIRVLYGRGGVALARKSETAQRIISDFASIPSDRLSRLPAGEITRLTAHRFQSWPSHEAARTASCDVPRSN